MDIARGFIGREVAATPINPQLNSPVKKGFSVLTAFSFLMSSRQKGLGLWMKGTSIPKDKFVSKIVMLRDWCTRYTISFPLELLESADKDDPCFPGLQLLFTGESKNAAYTERLAAVAYKVRHCFPDHVGVPSTQPGITAWRNGEVAITGTLLTALVFISTFSSEMAAKVRYAFRVAGLTESQTDYIVFDEKKKQKNQKKTALHIRISPSPSGGRFDFYHSELSLREYPLFSV
jgi:hypothetical protein